MKIADIQTTWLSIPLNPPLADSTHRLDKIEWIVVEVLTDQGIAGHSCMLTFDFGPQLLKGVIDHELKRVAVGMDAQLVGAVWEACWNQVEYIGQSGLAAWGIAAIDIALWDILGKTLDCPVYKLLGACRDSVPVYGSGGWLSYSLDQLLDEVTSYVKRGFRAVKIKVGSKDKSRDVARVKAVRQAIGADVKLMVDANQSWDPRSAIDVCRLIRDFDIFWVEEPVSKDDIDGYAQVASSIDIPVAAGEREFSMRAFRELLQRRAISIVQPDALRFGGISGCQKLAHLAEAYHAQVAPHFYKEIDVHLVASARNGIFIEYFPWLDDLLVHPLVISSGMAIAPSHPGVGLEFKPEAIREYKVIP
jgi:L-alanine-DL-glutamate epimerase-like enolase superfamily enzyme